MAEPPSPTASPSSADEPAGAKARVARIDDAADPRLDPFRDVRDRVLRGDSGLFMAESARVVRRLLRSDHRVRSVLVTPGARAALADELDARGGSLEVLEVPEGMEVAVAGARFHGGALALGERPRRPPSVEEVLARVGSAPPGGPRRVVLGEGITHADNIGSLFRSIACLGGHGAILDGACADPLLRQAIRFSMGRVFSTPWTSTDRLTDAIATLRRAGFVVAAAELSPRSRAPRELPRDRDVAILLGAEGTGLSHGSLAAADLVVEIPSPVPRDGDDPASLNVAVAAAILLYELGR